MYKYPVILLLLIFSATLFSQSTFDINAFEKERVITLANSFLKDKPVTITDFKAERSTGGLHDYFSEGDYWWPDEKNPTGPYIQKDGMTNPEIFVKHRESLRSFSVIVPALVAAYKVTGDTNYAKKAIKHLRAWFIADATKMNPHLLYAQAIRNKVTGRGIGIIDTIHLIELTKAVEALEADSAIKKSDAEKIRQWFREYLKWLTTHEYGIDESTQKNNHGTWWHAQVAAYASFVKNDSLVNFVRDRYTTVLLPNQMAKDGSFPFELKRTKPYNYSLFNLEGMAAICELTSDKTHNMFEYTLADGRSMKKGFEFITPFIVNKELWKYPKDVMHFENYPARQSALLFAYYAYKDVKYLEIWKTLKVDLEHDEIVRTFPIRELILWTRK